MAVLGTSSRPRARTSSPKFAEVANQLNSRGRRCERRKLFKKNAYFDIALEKQCLHDTFHFSCFFRRVLDVIDLQRVLQFCRLCTLQIKQTSPCNSLTNYLPGKSVVWIFRHPRPYVPFPPQIFEIQKCPIEKNILYASWLNRITFFFLSLLRMCTTLRSFCNVGFQQVFFFFWGGVIFENGMGSCNFPIKDRTLVRACVCVCGCLCVCVCDTSVQM